MEMCTAFSIVRQTPFDFPLRKEACTVSPTNSFQVCPRVASPIRLPLIFHYFDILHSRGILQFQINATLAASRTIFDGNFENSTRDMSIL